MIVFLDFDGVINSHDWWQRRGPRPKPPTRESDARWSFDPVAVVRLNRLATAGARFVISSTWRIKNDADELGAMLRACGFEGEVIGTTPDMSQRPKLSLYLPADRGHEINAWLDSNGPRPFVVIDDDYWPGMEGMPLVRTSFDNGLLDEHIDRALELLGVA